MMNNSNDIISQFKAEHDSVMLQLSIEGQSLGIYTAVDLRRALFAFADEVNAVVRLDGKARRGVSLYEDYWHAACALIPDDIARTDLLHALLFIFITAQGRDVLITRDWATRRGTVLGRLVDERTLASDVVNGLRREGWLDVEAVEALIKRGDVFTR
jgi:hypothetical protein